MKQKNNITYHSQNYAKQLICENFFVPTFSNSSDQNNNKNFPFWRYFHLKKIQSYIYSIVIKCHYLKQLNLQYLNIDDGDCFSTASSYVLGTLLNQKMTSTASIYVLGRLLNQKWLHLSDFKKQKLKLISIFMFSVLWKCPRRPTSFLRHRKR